MNELLNKYIDKVANLNLEDPDLIFELQYYSGMLTVLTDMYNKNHDLFDFNKLVDFQIKYNEIRLAYTNKLAERISKDTDMLKKLNEVNGVKVVDLTQKAPKSVAAIFDTELSDDLVTIYKNNNITDFQKLQQAKMAYINALQKASCSMEYYNRKVNDLEYCTTIDEIIEDVNKTIENGKKYAHNKK